MNNEKYKSTIGFTDLLFNILVGFAFLFIIAFLLIKPEAKKKDFDRRAEFVIIMEWDKDANGDIDLYVQDPLGDRCSFRLPVANFMHLDKDDLGSSNDSVVNADGTISTVKINREVITIRGIIRGEYIVNAHYYSEREWVKKLGEINNNVQKVGKRKDVTVRVELHKVNPYTILWVGEKKFHSRGQEETFLRFRLDNAGEVLSPFTFEKKIFVTPMAGSSIAPSGESGASAYEDEGNRL
jgi:hypothetical protein